jgi:hypothetical protein
VAYPLAAELTRSCAPAASNSLAGVLPVTELFNELHVDPPLKQLRDNKAV